MMILDNEDIFLVEVTEENKDYWINKEFISQDVKNKLKNSNIIFVPEKRYGVIGFHEGALPFFEYLEEKKNSEICANFCIDEENYQEFILHSYAIRLGEIIVESILLPILASYLYDYLKKRYLNSSDEDEIQIIMNIENENKNNIKFTYVGSLNNFKELISDVENFIKIIGRNDE